MFWAQLAITGCNSNSAIPFIYSLPPRKVAICQVPQLFKGTNIFGCIIGVSCLTFKNFDSLCLPPICDPVILASSHWDITFCNSQTVLKTRKENV